MKTTHSIRNLSLFAILTVLGATAHAAPSYQPQQLAENGSQRTLEQAEKNRELREVKIAEERSNAPRNKQISKRQDVAEARSGAPRSKLASKRQDIV